METTIVYWGYISYGGRMENKTETIMMGYIRIIFWGV